MKPHFGISGTVTLAEETMLQGMSLPLHAGWTCLLGASGAGKSTLLRLIGGLETPAKLDGERSVPEQIGWMAQTDLLQPRLSVLQNVCLLERLAGRKANLERATTLLSEVGLEDCIDKRPDELSGGQRQRVALARTLMTNADLILLDEPFSALDPATRAAMQELAFEKFSGKSVLLVTHDPNEALRLGQAVWLLEDQQLQPIAPLSGSKPVKGSEPALSQAAADLLDRIRGGV